MHLASTFKELERAVNTLQVVVRQLNDHEEELGHRIVLLASEAITNAMEHGNAWQPRKKATLRLTIQQESVELEVTDEGSGIRLPGHRDDPLRPENILDPHGRGIKFMQEFADELHVREGDNTVRLIFNRIPASAE